MTKDMLIEIKSRLEDLYDNYYIALRTTDGRRRERIIREAKLEISGYSQTIPSEVMDYFYREVGVNALDNQHTDDI